MYFPTTLFVMTTNLNKMGVKAMDAMFNLGGDTPTPHQVDLQTRKEDEI